MFLFLVYALLVPLHAQSFAHGQAEIVFLRTPSPQQVQQVLAPWSTDESFTGALFGNLKPRAITILSSGPSPSSLVWTQSVNEPGLRTVLAKHFFERKKIILPDKTVRFERVAQPQSTLSYPILDIKIEEHRVLHKVTIINIPVSHSQGSSFLKTRLCLLSNPWAILRLNLPDRQAGLRNSNVTCAQLSGIPL